ncbi:YecH family metal-binding protein [Parendozoicomonas sp. Alg238-R29]|uniref:YecH family metal-binding protein n=1 Tax=Parendozoicomonas sp. Alg238-R29 TaxID=2993446 RepID=UPI00248F116E|nr:YecH family metal-binding protein [Parendozoicomonas sp. Alg238-R29]
MAQSVHGRNVLKLVLESEQAQSREQLLQVIASEFGADVEFHTCSVQGLSAEALLELFLGKGKLVEGSEGIVADASKMCSHN